MAGAARRLAAIMFTDMVNYTALAQSDEPLALKVLNRHNRLLRPIFPRYRGRVVKTTGDGFLVEFDSALNATNCALEVLGSLHEFNATAPEEAKIQLRIGIHLGDVVHQRHDVLGDAVNIAARIEPLAEAGEVCVSGQVFDQVRNKVAAELLHLPPQAMKNVRFPVEVYRVVPRERQEGKPVVSTGSLDRHRLAVLPLSNISPDPRDEYLADGMTEELISTLSRLPSVQVVSRTSVTPYKERAKRAQEIGRELNVGTILEGSVRKVKDRVRIGIQMIDAGTDTHVWMESYDRELKDLFSIQREVAEKVASSLRIEIGEPERAHLARNSTEVTEARLLYLKGRHYTERWTAEGYRTAIELFERAIRLDPGYALALAALADVYSGLGFYELRRPAEMFARAERLSRRAARLDASLPEALHVLVAVLRFRGRCAESTSLLRRTMSLNPDRTETHLWLAGLHAFAGRQSESFDEARKALELDPLSEPTMRAVATWYLFSGHPDLGAELFEKVLRLDPDNGIARSNLGVCRVRLGAIEAGPAEVRKAMGLSPTFSPHQRVDLIYALVSAGREEEARGVLRDLVAFHRRHRAGAYAVASGYSLLGDREKTFEWLKVAQREGSAHLYGLAGDFTFDSVRQDPRFRATLKRYPSCPATALALSPTTLPSAAHA